jgi:hypothetical protein
MLRTQTGKYFNLREKITRELRILHNEELHNWFSSSNVMAIRSKRMR